MNERAMDIYNRHNNGESFASIAESYSISRCRVQQIFHKTENEIKALVMRHDTQTLEGFLYDAAEKLGVDDKVCTRAIGCLRRNKIRSVEDFLKTDNIELSYFRNVGDTTMFFYVKAKELAGVYEQDTLRNFLYKAEEKLSMGIGVCTRSVNALRRAGIDTIEDFLKIDTKQLFLIPDMGSKSLYFCLKAKEVMTCQE